MTINITQWFSKSPKVTKEPHVEISSMEVPLPSIVLIHGAHQSNVTFEYLRHALPGFKYINIEWHTEIRFQHNLDEMQQALQHHSDPVYMIGHSMGSIYAAHLSEHLNCIGGATIAAPWGGSKHADWLRYMMPSYPLYKEVGTKSSIITYARTMQLPGRWTNYVSTEGNIPGMGGPNDCVLTIESMTARRDLYTKYIKATHYEIVLSTDLIHSVGKNFLRASEKFTQQT